MGQKKPAQSGAERGLAHLNKATDTLSSLLAQQVRELDSRQRAARKEGAADSSAVMKGLKEATAVLKDLASVAKTLNEQGTENGESGCGVVLLPPVQTEENEP